MKVAVKQMLSLCIALNTLCYPAFAHEEFVPGVKFDAWVRHCHKDAILNSDECWAIYQGRIGNSESESSGFALFIPESRDPYYFMFRNVRLPYHTIEINVDEYPAIRFSCDVLVCSPISLDGEKTIMEQMDKGGVLFIRESEVASKGDALIAKVSLAEFN